MNDGSYKKLADDDWSKTKACVAYNGHIKCIGDYYHMWNVDSNTGKFTVC